MSTGCPSLEGLSVTSEHLQFDRWFFFPLFFSFNLSAFDRRRDEESGAAIGGESRLHPAGVFALRHRGRQQQRPVVVSSRASMIVKMMVMHSITQQHPVTPVTTTLITCVMGFNPQF